MKKLAIGIVLLSLASTCLYAQIPPQGYIGLFADENYSNYCVDGTGLHTFYCFALPSETGIECVEFATALSSPFIAVFNAVYGPEVAQPVLGGVPGDLALCFNSCQSTGWVEVFSATLYVMDYTMSMISLEPFTGSPYMKVLNCEAVEVEALPYAYLHVNDPECFPPPPPPILSYVTVQDESHIMVTFTECLYELQAEDPDSYTLFPKDNPADTVAVSAAEMSNWCNEVVLTLEQPLIQGVVYTLIAQDMCNSWLGSCATSQIDFIFPEIAALLQGFEAEYGPGGVELSWELAGVDGDISFEVSRRGAMGESFDELSSVDIERDGDTYTCIDTSAEPGESYVYRVDYELDGETAVLFETDVVQTPAAPLTLHQNVPNPFNPATEISYYLPAAVDVLLEVYDVTGKRVATLERGRREKGLHVVMWQGMDDSGRSAQSGIYFYRLRAGKEVTSKKMVLLR